MSTTRDYYDALGVSKSATFDEIRSAFRRLAREYHPDVNKSDDAASKFSEVTEAYEVLSDPEKREKYDQFGHAGPRGQGWPGGPAGMGGHPSDVSAIFEELFGTRSPFGGGMGGGPGGGFGGAGGGGFDPFATGQSAPRRGRDINHRIQVTWMTAALGGTETVQVKGPSGGRDTISLKIPPGLEPEAKLRVAGRGEQGPGASSGDLIVTVDVGSHPLFRREGRNVLIDLPLTIAEAALGTTVTVPLLRGSVDLKVPPGTSSGRSLRVKGQGIRGGKGPDGDFLAVVKIVPPKPLTERGRALMEELASELQNPRDSGPWSEARS